MSARVGACWPCSLGRHCHLCHCCNTGPAYRLVARPILPGPDVAITERDLSERHILAARLLRDRNVPALTCDPVTGEATHRLLIVPSRLIGA